MKTFAYKGFKIVAQQKKVCFSTNFALLAGFFGIGATIRISREMLCLPYAELFRLGIGKEKLEIKIFSPQINI